MNHPPPSPLKLSGTMLKVLSAYSYWHNITRHIPKMRRYSLGIKIDALFANIIELVSMTQFSPKIERENILTKAISKNDCLKSMLYVLFELKGIEEKHFVEIAVKVEEIGRILYGWKNQPVKIINSKNAQVETLGI